MVIVIAATNRIEFTGVRCFGWSRENHCGKRRSQPATIGSRGLPLRWTLVAEIERTVMRMMPAEAMDPAKADEVRPSRNVCGTGPIKSIGLSPMNASTELVPRMNARAMIGDAITTDLPISRAGERVSPAKMATYSKPLRAPTDILVKMFR